MQIFKKLIYILCTLFCSLMFFSCTTELTLQFNKNGSVDIKFVGGAGEAFTQMIVAASDENSEVVFDVDEISYQLGKSGFSKVMVESKNATDLTVNMSDINKSSYLFTSGIAAVKDSKLEINLDAAKLLRFYNSADEVIQMVLDLLIAPVFNEEQMEETEYLEVVSSFYGQAASTELQYSNVKIKIIQPDGTKTETLLPLVKLLTLTNSIKIN